MSKYLESAQKVKNEIVQHNILLQVSLTAFDYAKAHLQDTASLHPFTDNQANIHDNNSTLCHKNAQIFFFKTDAKSQTQWPDNVCVRFQVSKLRFECCHEEEYLRKS